MGDVIFVEGPPGAGKSTTAQFLARQLTHHGRPARWIYEEEVPNPFVPEMPEAAWETWDEFADAHEERWRAFARVTAAARETLVVESYLLQRPVFTMLRRDAEPTAIESLVNRFARAVAALNPTLLYLAHPDPEESWRAVAAERGTLIAQSVSRSETWPFTQSRGLTGLDGLLAYWRAHATLSDAIVSRLPMQRHVVDVTTGGWPERRQHLCTLLGIPAAEPAAPDPVALVPFIGQYRDGEREITVSFEDGRLVLRGVLWASNALLPVARNIFEVEAWPLRVSFEDEALHWHGPRLWWGGPAGVYVR